MVFLATNDIRSKYVSSLTFGQSWASSMKTEMTARALQDLDETLGDVFGRVGTKRVVRKPARNQTLQRISSDGSVFAAGN